LVLAESRYTTMSARTGTLRLPASLSTPADTLMFMLADGKPYSFISLMTHLILTLPSGFSHSPTKTEIILSGRPRAFNCLLSFSSSLCVGVLLAFQTKSHFFIGVTTIIILPSRISRVQSNLSPFSKLNCLTMFAGTVVLREIVFGAALVRLVISPMCITFVWVLSCVVIYKITYVSV